MTAHATSPTSYGRANRLEGAPLVGFHPILAALSHLLPGVETA